MLIFGAVMGLVLHWEYFGLSDVHGLYFGLVMLIMGVERGILKKYKFFR